MQNWLIKIKCKYFGHIFPKYPNRQASLPTSGGRRWGNLYVPEWYICERCGFEEERQGRWD